MMAAFQEKQLAAAKTERVSTMKGDSQFDVSDAAPLLGRH